MPSARGPTRHGRRGAKGEVPALDSPPASYSQPIWSLDQHVLVSAMTERKLVLSVTAKECREDRFRCSGAGGQNVNKVETGVRFTHEPSGAVGQSCDERSQLQNRRIAWKRMVNSHKFQLWLKKVLGHGDAQDAELERSVARRVERDMRRADLLWEDGYDLVYIAKTLGVTL